MYSPALEELHRLIGLAPVKAEIDTLLRVAYTNRSRRNAGLPEFSLARHLVFTGNPGTGKTTVARLLGQLFREAGLLSSGAFVEATRADLVAVYVGQTAPKVEAVVASAVGGILFIDEAYSLSRGHGMGHDFGGEAIDTLVPLMETHRDELVVIVAGYPEEMREFIDSNPGLQSRFTTYIDFPDYADAELAEIFHSYASPLRLIVTRGVEHRVALALAQIQRGKGFGNARDVRRLFEQTVARQAARLSVVPYASKEQLSLVLPLDVPVPGYPLLEERESDIRPDEPSVGRESLVFGQPPGSKTARRNMGRNQPTLLSAAPAFIGWRSELAVSPTEVLLGRTVYHPAHGVGTVLTELGGSPPMLRVRFDSAVEDLPLGSGFLEIADF